MSTPPNTKAAPSFLMRITGRVISTQLKESAVNSTPVTLAGIEVAGNGDILCSVNMLVRVSNRRAQAVRVEFTPTHVRDLRALAELSRDEDVRRAAAAVLRFADGASYAKAVEETGYSIGWLRPLIAEVLTNGAQAIEQRSFRPSRARSGKVKRETFPRASSE